MATPATAATPMDHLRERQLMLARRERGPIALLAEIARHASGPERSADVVDAVLTLLERDLGLERVALGPVPDESCAGALRVPVPWKQQTIAHLVARGANGAAPSAEHQAMLALAARLIAERVHDEHQGSAPALNAASDALPPALLGESPAAQALRHAVARVADSDATVLLVGESGSGREMVARAIAARGARTGQPFVVVNCAALRGGLAELASGPSTLFLDQVAELPRTAQAELSRLLCAQRAVRSGGGAAKQRVIAAASESLANALRAGRFRQDLYYQLEEFPIELPALRERRGDIAALALHFVTKHAARSKREVARISDSALELLAAYHWPGNLRELENCMSRAVLLAHYGVVRQHHLPRELQPGGAAFAPPRSLDERIAAFERALIDEALAAAHGHHGAAARLLGVTPRVLSYRLRRVRADRAPRAPIDSP